MSKILNHAVGVNAEKKAVEYLKKQHYKIIETNYSCKIGEIDIVAYDKKTLVFVEVKYRDTAYFGLPREAVNSYKQHKIRLVASSYINSKALHDKECRFDVVDILGNEITLIKNCF